MSVAPINAVARDRRADFGIAAERLGLRVLPALLLALMLVLVFRLHQVATDFRHAYYPAADRLIHGASPYAVTHAQIVGGAAFVYPALSAVVLVPFALLGPDLGRILFTLLCLACAPATLRVLGIRDWRLYGVACIWLPVFAGWQTANVTMPLILMTALTWRYRDRPLIAGLLTAAAISLKPFVWPLALWLLATGRFRATASTVAWAAVLNLLAWWIVGFSQLHAFLHVSALVTDALWRLAYGIPAVAHHFGLGRGASDAVLLILSAPLAVGVLYCGWARRGDRAALTLAIALMLVASPLVRSHYFAFLLIPFALYRPRLNWLWFVPITMWAYTPAMNPVGWQALITWLITGGCLIDLLRRRGAAAADGGVRAGQISTALGADL